MTEHKSVFLSISFDFSLLRFLNLGCLPSIELEQHIKVQSESVTESVAMGNWKEYVA